MAATTSAPVTIGVSPPGRFDELTLEARRSALTRIADAGLDHVFFADHVSFHTGVGMDGMIQAAALSQHDDRLGVYLGVYLLALRHPVAVARQLSTISEFAPGRLVFGVGVGGEDRHEMEVCGVDPRTRGRRTDECLEILHGLAAGEPFDFDGEFFTLEAAQIVPAPSPRIPITIGGRSEAALRRTARFGDGWIAAWTSVERFAAGVDRIDELASEAGRDVSGVDWQHGMQVWCGLGDSAEAARPFVAAQMERLYRIPFDKFERHTPCGTPDDIAGFLRPFVEAGCRTVNLKVCGASTDDEIAGAAEVRRLLNPDGANAS